MFLSDNSAAAAATAAAAAAGNESFNGYQMKCLREV